VNGHLDLEDIPEDGMGGCAWVLDRAPMSW
jgi:hypothetical protein